MASTDGDEIDPAMMAAMGFASFGAQAGQKRKFELDDEHLSQLSADQEEKALLDIEREQLEKSKAKLPNFWLVHLNASCWSD